MPFDHVFLLGAAKSGTTSLAETLDTHPDVHLSPAKETAFFQRDREFEQGLEFYRERYFPDRSDGEYLLDAAHRHLYLPWVPERIDSTVSEPRFIVILRDPVQRAFSHYWHWRRSGRSNTETLSFEDALHQDLIRIESGKNHTTERERKLYQRYLTDVLQGLYRTYLDSGYYLDQLQRYTDRFGRDSLRVVFFEEFVEDPRSVTRKIENFLGVPESVSSVRATNEGFVPRSETLQRLYALGYRLSNRFGLTDFIPKSLIKGLRALNAGEKNRESMSSLTERWLSEHYQPHNERLEDFLGRDLPDEWSYDYTESDWEPVRSDVFSVSEESES